MDNLNDLSRMSTIVTPALYNPNRTVTLHVDLPEEKEAWYKKTCRKIKFNLWMFKLWFIRKWKLVLLYLLAFSIIVVYYVKKIFQK